MLAFFSWMVTEYDDTSSEIQRDPPPDNWSKLSFVLHVFLPVAGLLIFFKQKHIFSRLLLQLDRNCVSVFCPSFSRREKLLKWAGSRLPETWSSQSRTLSGGVGELWSDGSLLCTLINSVIPGACPNPHRHWKKPPLHAQAIAYKYLGVVPIFIDDDLKGNLTVNLERDFLHYLNELQKAITNISEKNDIPKTVSTHYVVRGMGLYSGEQHRKTIFYVYPSNNIASHSSNIIVHIRGPYATYGKAIIPKLHNELFNTPEIKVSADSLTTKTLLNGNSINSKNFFMKNFSLPFMQYHKKHMGDNIVIDVTIEGDRAKVTYIPKNYGMYEIIMVSNGELIRGCPYNVHILNNVSGIEDNFDREEKIEDIPGLRRRKILSKTIDFIDEQMPMADLLKRYKSKETFEIDTHVDKKIIRESIKKKNESKENETEENKFDTDRIVPCKINSNLAPNPERIEEEDEVEIFELYNKKMDKSQLNLKTHFTEERDEVILEKQNSESTSEICGTKLNIIHENDVVDHIFNENNQTHDIIYKVNSYTDNASPHKVINNDVSVELQFKSTTESTNDDKKLQDGLDQKKQIFTAVCKISSNELMPYLTKKIEVSKIKIPEKFCQAQNISNTNLNDGNDTKYFKNVINTSNKREIPKSVSTSLYKTDVKYMNKEKYRETNNSPTKIIKHIKNDDNNNNIPNMNRDEAKENVVSDLYHKNSDTKKAKVVPKRFLKHQQHQNAELPLDGLSNTSPICPNHIALEVENEFVQMSVAERRKIFANKVHDRISSSTNSSFSETENAEGSLKRENFKQFEGLSVLNYLGSLKKSQSNKNREAYSLCSTMSLPNISSIENVTFHSSVKERRNFWEKVSTSSSSLSIYSEASLKRKPKRLTEVERSKLIWKKPDEITMSNTSINTSEESSDLEKSAEISKSADDILSVTTSVAHEASKKFKSMDLSSLDKCIIVSIDERKKMLLKQFRQRDDAKKQVARAEKNNCIKENHKILKNEFQEIKHEDKNTNTVFSPISERIKKFDSACNLSNNKIEKSEEKITQVSIIQDNNKVTPVTSKNVKNEDTSNLTKSEILTVKSHFNRAIKYFKNLEEKSINTSNNNLTLNNYRRYSLDVPPNKHKNYKKGGSLNLQNVKQRFSLTNLYEDVFGDKKGSFKGAANRTALVEALATFSKKENRSVRADEDNIVYEIFQKKTKTKKRRSIRSVFDIYY